MDNALIASTRIMLSVDERILRKHIEDIHIFTAILDGRGSEFCFISRQRAQERLDDARNKAKSYTQKVHQAKALLAGAEA